MSQSFQNQSSDPIASKMLAQQQGGQLQQAGSSVMRAEAVAPATATTSEQVAIGTAKGPACGLPQVERAVGQAEVDASVAEGLAPDLSHVQQAMQRLVNVEAEKASQQAAAQAALQQAGLLMAQAARQEAEALKAAELARSEMLKTQQDLSQQAEIIKREREAMAAKDKIGAEMEARQAAKAKAEETAAAEAARLAAAEAAEADAMVKVAAAKKQQAMAAMVELEARMKDAKIEASRATQRAADLTAKSEAHHREAELAGSQVQEATRVLDDLEKQVMHATEVPPSGSNKVAAAFVPVPDVQTKSLGTSKTTKVVEKREDAFSYPGVSEWQPLTTYYKGSAQPRDTDFPYLLHLRIPAAQIGSISGSSSSSMLPSRVVLRFTSGGIVSVTDRALDPKGSSKWNVEGNLPIKDPMQLVQISVLDATGFSNWHSFDWDRARVIGQLHLKISNLMDGHISKDNSLRLDGLGGYLFASLHLEKWNTSGSSTRGTWGWNKHEAGPDFWTLRRSSEFTSTSTTGSSFGQTSSNVARV